jgi:hypothetical protein
MDYQLPFQPFSSAYDDLSDPDNEFVNYFASINHGNIAPIINERYAGVGPSGYGVSLVLTRILKVKEIFFSDRVLARKLKTNATYRSICLLDKSQTPSHNTYNTLRKRLGVEGFRQIHRRFVLEAHGLGLLAPEMPQLPKTRRNGIIVVGDSTFIRATCSTKGEKQKDGSWLFQDDSVSFGRPNHKYRYPVGHKAHSLMSVTGIPLVSIVTAAGTSDQSCIIELVKELFRLYPELPFAYIILDRGYDADEIYQTLYEIYNILPIIIRKKMVYPKGFTKAGYPLCPFGYALTRIGIDYKRKRTKYCCRKVCLKRPKQQNDLFSCDNIGLKNSNGITFYTHFKDSYRKYGPTIPSTIIYKRLKPLRTAIEREYGLIKENRYRMEYINTYTGIENVTMHVVEHDIALAQDIIFDFKRSGLKSPVIKV